MAGSSQVSILNKPRKRRLKVTRKEQVSPGMLRVILAGEDLADFPADRESANFKLILPSKDSAPVVRTYSVRSFDESALELAVDFYRHSEAGPGSQWAASVAIGEAIEIAGPGPAKFVDFTADWFLFAGDMSALPAISANIERLPSDATGYAVFEIESSEDIQSLKFPEGMQVNWLVRTQGRQPCEQLIEAVRACDWRLGRPAVWLAGESGAVRTLRRYFKEERGVERSDLYASGYWQLGLTEDAHQKIKRQSADS